MKIVLVELSDETGEVAVLEVFREDRLGEFLVLSSQTITKVSLVSMSCTVAVASFRWMFGSELQGRDATVPPRRRSYRPRHPIEQLRSTMDLPAFYNINAS